MSAMTRPPKIRKVNHNVGNSTSIEDLDDHLLTQILFRLPSCASVLSCTPVNKRWYSLISDPRFATQFSDHKTRNATLSKSRCNNINDNKPEWTYLITVITTDYEASHGPLMYCVGNASSTNEVVFGSPKFYLGYLPCSVEVEATFMDLLLCSNIKIGRGLSDWIYYVTNPITKQWVNLPPCPGIRHQCVFKPWVAFVCRQPLDFTQDYQFRVVLIDQELPQVKSLSVYCSEIGMWKTLYLGVRTLPSNDTFQCAVCNGIIYLYNKSCFAAFDPFDVDETTENATTIDAKILPSLQVDGFLLESSGSLFVIHDQKNEWDLVCYDRFRNTIEMSLQVWKFNLNQVPLEWKMTIEGTCSGSGYEDELSLDLDTLDTNLSFCFPADIVGMHPKDDKLIHMHLPYDNHFVSCDMRSRLIKPFKSINIGGLLSFHRFEPQWWPTSVPRPFSSH